MIQKRFDMHTLLTLEQNEVCDWFHLKMYPTACTKRKDSAHPMHPGSLKRVFYFVKLFGFSAIFSKGEIIS